MSDYWKLWGPVTIVGLALTAACVRLGWVLAAGAVVASTAGAMWLD